MSPPRASQALRALLPPAGAPEEAYAAAFRAMADLLLNRAALIAAGAPHRFTEIEFYYRGGEHRDDFTHGDPMQGNFGTWYFHRNGGEYRGGTWKGLDIAIGDGEARGGILIRGIAPFAPVSTIIDGPCVVVDHLLSLHRCPSVRALAERFDLGIDAPDEPPGSPLWIRIEDAHRGQRVLETARVGLTLKRGDVASRRRTIALPCRFLTEPARIRKGKPQLFVALHREGASPVEIARATASTAAAVRRAIDGYERGRSRALDDFDGDIPPDDLCELLGAWDSRPA